MTIVIVGTSQIVKWSVDTNQ